LLVIGGDEILLQCVCCDNFSANYRWLSYEFDMDIPSSRHNDATAKYKKWKENLPTALQNRPFRIKLKVALRAGLKKVVRLLKYIDRL